MLITGLTTSVMLILAYLIPIVLGLLILYWVVRKAVCAGIRDARQDDPTR